MMHRTFILFFCLLLSTPAFAQFELRWAPDDDLPPSEFEEFIDENAPSEDAFVAVQRLAYRSTQDHQWDDAATIYKKYKPKFPEHQARFDKIIAILEAPSSNLTLRNLSSGVNSSKDEFGPIISADGKKLYFTREGGDETHEDVMVSQLMDAQWQTAQSAGSTIFTVHSEGIDGLAADGNRILLFGHYDGDFGHGDMYYADKAPSGEWGPVQHWPKPLNSEYFEADGCYASSGKAIIFASDRPGVVGELVANTTLGHGEKWGNTDLFVSVLQADGTWGEPNNLGSTINTQFSERMPFLHPDGKTLYFCSTGQPGLGKMDIFKSTRLSDTSWTEWSEPVNLGKDINDAETNFGFCVSTDGRTALVSLDNRKDGYGNGDLYTIELPQALRPTQVATISGIIADENGAPISASLKWDDLSTGKNAGMLSSDPKSGSYFITLPLDKNFGYYAEKEGYYPVSSNVDLRGKTESVSRTENITLVSIKAMREKGMAVRLNNLFFDFDKAALKPESFPELGRLVAFLKANPDMKTEIGGHTDNKGSHAYNLDLSKKRTKAVVDYLVSNGCDAKTLSAKGYAETLPVATNDTDEGRAQNRRVEVKFLK